MENLNYFPRLLVNLEKADAFHQSFLSNDSQYIFFYLFNLHMFFHQHIGKHRELHTYLFQDKILHV
jgi:hypothetical protein